MSAEITAVLRVAIAAACMAHGLTAAEAEQVTRMLWTQPRDETTEEVYEQVAAAISEVRSRRQERRATRG